MSRDKTFKQSYIPKYSWWRAMTQCFLGTNHKYSGAAEEGIEVSEVEGDFEIGTIEHFAAYAKMYCPKCGWVYKDNMLEHING